MHSFSRTCGKLNKEIIWIIFQIIIDLNSKTFNCSIFNLGAQYFVLLKRMFGARMVHDTKVHQIFLALIVLQKKSSEISIMYSAKSVGTKIKPWGTPDLTGYYWEDFSFRTTWTHLLLRNNKAKYMTWNSVRPEFWKRQACQTVSKVLQLQ